MNGIALPWRVPFAPPLLTDKARTVTSGTMVPPIGNEHCQPAGKAETGAARACGTARRTARQSAGRKTAQFCFGSEGARRPALGRLRGPPDRRARLADLQMAEFTEGCRRPRPRASRGRAVARWHGREQRGPGCDAGRACVGVGARHERLQVRPRGLDVAVRRRDAELEIGRGLRRALRVQSGGNGGVEV
jgi:hypothetical protein